MKNLIREILLQEALKPSQFRKYVKAFNRERYVDIFKSLGNKFEHDRNYYRIYIPLTKEEKSGPVSNVEKEVVDFLTQNGYQVLDYIKGIAKFGEAKNTTTIGKALTRLKADDLMKKFVSDESRKALTSDASNLMVVISRHPYDIAGSDTDRNWTNCMTIAHPNSERLTPLLNQYDEKRKEKDKWDNYFYHINIGKIKPSKKEHETNLKDYDTFLSKYDSESVSRLKDDIDNRKISGENVKYLINDVKEGSLISYLIKKDDKNIQNPIAVLNIKPYVNELDKNDFILLSDSKMYGNGRPEFKKTVDSILNEINGDSVSGFYCLNEKLYRDSENRVRILPREKLIYIKKYLYNKFMECRLKPIKNKNWEGWTVYVDKKGKILFTDNINSGEKDAILFYDLDEILVKLKDMGLNDEQVQKLCIDTLYETHNRKVDYAYTLVR